MNNPLFKTKQIQIQVGTPTSLIFGQEPDLNQLHVLKDCSNHALGHELVPIVTMNDQMLPEVLDNIPQQQQMHQHQAMIQPCVSNVLTGVYTLAEEPELEAEENTPM